MEVILRQRIQKLGQRGDVVSVKAGYARNYLLRRGLVDIASDEKIALFKSQEQQLIADDIEHKKEAVQIAEKMQNLSICLVRQAGETGLLYGSVRRKDLMVELLNLGFKVSSDQVEIQKPIKTLGTHIIDVVLHTDVRVPVVVSIALTNEEARDKIEKYMAENKVENKAEGA